MARFQTFGIMSDTNPVAPTPSRLNASMIRINAEPGPGCDLVIHRIYAARPKNPEYVLRQIFHSRKSTDIIFRVSIESTFE